MPERVDVISMADRVRWEREHQEGGLPSQSWGHAAALARSGVKPQLAVVQAGGSRMLMSFHERSWAGSVDITTTLGLSPTSIEPASDAPLAAWRDYAAARGWVAGYVQLAPGTTLENAGSTGRLVQTNEVFLLDLRGRDLLRDASEIVRRKARRSAAAGVTAVDDPDVVAKAARELYPAAMRRLGAASTYDFSGDTVEAWVRDAGCLALGAAVGGRVEAVSLFLFHGRHAEYHINAASEEGRAHAAWLICEAAARLRAGGIEQLNLGGGVRPGDGLHQFKARFNGTPVPLRSVRQVYDARRFSRLCEQAGVLEDGPFFPPYHVRGRA